MMVSVRPLELTDIMRVFLRSKTDKSYDYFFHNVQSCIENSVDILTFYVGSQPAAIFGVSMERPGVGLVWFFTTDLVRKNKIQFHKTVKNLFRDYIESGDLVRLEGHVCVDSLSAVKWAKSFGFQIEGKMRKFFEGDDYYMMAWVRDA